MNCYEHVRKFKKKYPGTIAWRLKKHAKIIDKYINPGEKILFAFAAQKNESLLDIFSTAICALTDKRLVIGKKRVLFGYSFVGITPDLFNDLTIYAGLFWGKVTIDTVKEVVVFTNISKRALDEIETAITDRVMKEKKKYNERVTEVSNQ